MCQNDMLLVHFCYQGYCHFLKSIGYPELLEVSRHCDM